MQIVFHIGANCTDGDILVKSLVKNAPALAERGVSIPGIARYRRLIRETIQNLGGNPPLPDTSEILLDAILEESSARRLVLSNSAFICLPTRVFDGGEFYRLTSQKIKTLQQLFPHAELQICFALRNPATFVPAAWSTVRNRTFQAFMNGLDPRMLRWSDVLTRIQAAAPSARLTVWCNEDTPLIWGEILRRMTGIEAGTRLMGEFDVLSTIMTGEGMARFASYLSSHPPQNDMQMRRVISAFLDKYAIPEEIEEEIDLPGWDTALVEDLTAIYEADIEQIKSIEGIDFIES